VLRNGYCCTGSYGACDEDCFDLTCNSVTFFFFFCLILTLNLYRQLDRFLIVIDLDDCIGHNASNQLCQLKCSIICGQKVAELTRVSIDTN
jgi:NAD-dependent dihydropyrimidine dehydrogenase PreA subunit